MMTTFARRHASKVKTLAGVIIVVSAVFLIRAMPFEASIAALGNWIEGLGWWGPVIFGLTYVVATILLVPGLVLTLAAGAIFGVAVGTVVVSLGSTIGAACAFLIARYVARDRVARFTKGRPRFDAVDRAIGEGGWKVVALMRLSPAIPFNLQNYLYGLTSIRFWPCMITSWIAMLPATVMYVAIGDVTGAAATGQRDRTTAEWVALGVGVAATIAVTVYLTKVARQKLKERPDLESPAESDDSKETGWPWGATAMLGLALVLAAAAGYVLVNPPS